jgi:hypothetical protein
MSIETLRAKIHTIINEIEDEAQPSWVLMLTINEYHPITHSPRLGFQPAEPLLQSNKNRNTFVEG